MNIGSINKPRVILSVVDGRLDQCALLMSPVSVIARPSKWCSSNIEDASIAFTRRCSSGECSILSLITRAAITSCLHVVGRLPIEAPSRCPSRCQARYVSQSGAFGVIGIKHDCNSLRNLFTASAGGSTHSPLDSFVAIADPS